MIKSIKYGLWFAILVCWTAACGGSGSGSKGGGSAPPPPPPAPPQPNLLHTTVGIYPNSYRKLEVSPCIKYVDYSLPDLTTTGGSLQIDGNLTEWATVPAYLTDPVTDAPASIDLAEVQVALAEEGLAIALAFQPATDSSLFFEFGGVLSRDEEIHTEVKHFFRYIGGEVHELRPSGWETIGPDLLQVVTGAQGTEVKFSDRLVGDTTTWPAWWVRVIAQDGPSGIWDSTHAAYFPSVLGGNAIPFSFLKCTQWGGKPSRVSQVMITHYIPPPQIPPPEYEEDGTFESRREHAFQLGRYALDLALSMTDHMHYGSGVQSVFVSDHVSEGIQSARSIDHELISNGATYRMLGINSKEMGFRPTIHFPQGYTVESGLNFHIQHMLRTGFQTAGPGLVHVATLAASHQFVKKYIGPQHWLNHRFALVQPFLTKPDTAKPAGLDQMFLALKTLTPEKFEPAERYYQAKSRAAAQLLGEIFSVDELLAAWITTSKNTSPASAPETKSQQFATNLFTALEKDDPRTLLAGLMDGYLVPKPYHPDFDPQAHVDQDLDGLPLFVEKLSKTSDKNPDTDQDGWSDLVEHTGGFDPNSASQVPGLIVADGIFSEWQNLLASKIIVDKGHSGLCERDADIQFYAAIGTADHLVIGAVAGDFWQAESKARWEAVIDIPSEERVLIVVAPNSERVVQIKDPADNRVLLTYPIAVPAGGKVAEILVDRAAMRLKTPFNKEQGIKIRLRTAYEADEGNIFCDETDWFAPYLK